MICHLWDLRSQTRDQTHASWDENAKIQPLDNQEIPPLKFLNFINYRIN